VITSTIVALRDARSWDPVVLTAAALEWPGHESRTSPLREIATALLADGWVEGDLPVITPGSLDPVGWGVRRRSRKYRGAAFQVRESERGLRPGDVLVPTTPELPLLLVRPDHLGSLVSSAFLALRPGTDLALWIWGVLSSASGRAFRAHLATGTVSRATTKSAMLDLEIPIPPLIKLNAIDERLRVIERSTHREEEEASGTWWRTADLSRGDWSVAFATPDPKALDIGIPLGDLCREIVRGRHVPLEEYRDSPGDELLPVTDIAVLGGKPVRRWVAAEQRPTIAEPGDVFVAAVGARPHAVLATATTAVDRNLFVLRLRDRATGPAIARYLNGQTGYGLRQMLLTGAVIPGIRKDNLARLPVLPEVFDSTGTTEPLVPLDLQLEHALWS
jgi:hypothetical protein